MFCACSLSMTPWGGHLSTVWTVLSTLREAQRVGVQLLSSLSRQFQSSEMHLVFDEGVHLSWEGDQHHQAEESSVSVRQSREAVRGLSSSASSHMSPPASAATDTDGQGEGLSLTRFLSNVVVACPQVLLKLTVMPMYVQAQGAM